MKINQLQIEIDDLTQAKRTKNSEKIVLHNNCMKIVYIRRKDF